MNDFKLPNLNGFVPISAEDKTDVFSSLFKQRIIMFFSPVTSETAALLIAQLLTLKAESDKPIYLYINSPGGSIYDCLSIVDVMHSCKIVATIGLGLCASAASILLISGTKGYRYIYPHGTVMMHQPSIRNIGGTLKDLTITLNQVENLYDLLLNIVENAIGINKENARQLLERDSYFTAQQAKELGLLGAVDHIITQDSDQSKK